MVFIRYDNPVDEGVKLSSTLVIAIFNTYVQTSYTSICGVF